MKSVCSERVPFGISTHQINNVNGKPQTRKIGLRWKYVSSILFDKVAEFNGELYFSNDGDIAKKTRCDGGSRQTKSTEVHYNSRYTTDLHELDAGWQTHKCLGRGLCCPEKFRKFLTMVEPERKNGGISSILPTRISFPANQWYRRKCTLRSSQPTRYQEAQMGNPNPYKCCDSGNSFRPSYPT